MLSSIFFAPIARPPIPQNTITGALIEEKKKGNQINAEISN